MAKVLKSMCFELDNVLCYRPIAVILSFLSTCIAKVFVCKQWRGFEFDSGWQWSTSIRSNRTWKEVLFANQTSSVTSLKSSLLGTDK